MAKKTGLGKGLDSLISSAYEDKVQEKEDKIAERYIKTRLIEPNRNQPRKVFDEDALAELTESIRTYGVIQPIIVQKKGDHYEIIAGERRWRAAKMAGMKEVPVIVKEYTEKEIAEISLIENLQREDLNPIEEALAYKSLMNEFNLKQDEVALRVSKSRASIANALRLLKLDEKLQTLLVEGLISTGHAKVLLGLDDKELQILIAEKIIDDQLSVRETEKYVKQLMNQKETKKTDKKELDNESLYFTLEERMKAKMGSMVHIRRKSEDRGKIEIEYYTKDDLERIIEAMGIYQES